MNNKEIATEIIGFYLNDLLSIVEVPVSKASETLTLGVDTAKKIEQALDDKDIQWEAAIANAPSYDYLLAVISRSGLKRLASMDDG